MNHSRWTWIGAALLICSTGCSSDDDGGSGGSGGQAGTGGTASTGGTGGTANTGGTAGTGGTSTGGSAAGGSAGAASCVDDTNPMFGSCVEDFLSGCWAPDLSGTCSSDNGVTLWEDGSKYDPQGNVPGIYGAGDTTPCIDFQLDNGNITATKGSETLLYTSDNTNDTATITCPDSSTFQVTFEQVTAFNTCLGLNCPE